MYTFAAFGRINYDDDDDDEDALIKISIICGFHCRETNG